MAEREEFDLWLEHALSRELGRAHRPAPRQGFVPRARTSRRLAPLMSGAGGALALKAATGVAVAAFAFGATGAVTRTIDPGVLWGHVIGEDAGTQLTAPRPEDAPSRAPQADQHRDAGPAPIIVAPQKDNNARATDGDDEDDSDWSGGSRWSRHFGAAQGWDSGFGRGSSDGGSGNWRLHGPYPSSSGDRLSS